MSVLNNGDTGAAARAIINAKVQRPQTASGEGQFSLINTSAGSAAVLPAGGTWAYFITPYTLATGVLTGTPAASIANGGTTIGAATTGITWVGFCWRIT